MPKKFAGEPFFAVLQKVLVPKKFEQERRGDIKIFPRFFLSHSAEKFRRGESLVFHSFRVWKILDKRGGGYEDFPPVFLKLRVPKFSLGGYFAVSLISESKKFG